MQLARRLEADPAGGAGDQRHLSVQIECRHRPAAYWSRRAIRVQRRCPVSSPPTAISRRRAGSSRSTARRRPADAAAGRVEVLPAGAGGPRQASRGRPTGVAGQLAYTRNKTFRFNVALTEVPDSTAFAPRVFCIRQGRRTRDDEFYGFEARDSKLWTESAALSERYLVSTSPFQDQNWLRQLFSPAFIDWLSTEPPADFSFELAYGALLGTIEEDDPTPAALAALCDATAHVAERIAPRVRGVASDADQQDRCLPDRLLRALRAGDDRPVPIPGDAEASDPQIDRRDLGPGRRSGCSGSPAARSARPPIRTGSSRTG